MKLLKFLYYFEIMMWPLYISSFLIKQLSFIYLFINTYLSRCIYFSLKKKKRKLRPYILFSRTLFHFCLLFINHSISIWCIMSVLDLHNLEDKLTLDEDVHTSFYLLALIYLIIYPLSLKFDPTTIIQLGYQLQIVWVVFLAFFTLIFYFFYRTIIIAYGPKLGWFIYDLDKTQVKLNGSVEESKFSRHKNKFWQNHIIK